MLGRERGPILIMFKVMGTGGKRENDGPVDISGLCFVALNSQAILKNLGHHRLLYS